MGNKNFRVLACALFAMLFTQSAFSIEHHGGEAEENNGFMVSASDEGESNVNWFKEDVWKNPERGFLFYPPDKPKEVKKKPVEPEPEKQVEKPKSIKEMQTLEEVQAELKRLKSMAIMNPNQANVLNYLQAQTFVMEKSSVFADTARRVAWQNPEVDYNAKRPTANFAIATQRERKAEEEKRALQALAETNGLLFFYKKDCSYCHDQAPVLQMFERRYGIPVMAVSLDGTGIKEFPNAKPDNGISLKVSNGRGINVTPTIYLLDRKTKSAVPLGQGVLAMEDIVDRIWVLTQTSPGQEFNQ